MDVTAPVGGLVTSTVDVGTAVSAGRPVVLVEVMKMEHPVTLEVDVVVEALHVAVGEEVEEGQSLATVTPTGTTTASTGDEGQGGRADLDELRRRQHLRTDEARPRAVAARHERRSRTARENVEDLCDTDTFVEYGGLAVAAQRTRRPLEELHERTPADGLVTGIGSVDGRPVAVAAYDATVLAGTQGAINHEKLDRLLDLAEARRLPVVLFAEGGGGRPGDTDVLGASFLDVVTFARFASLVGHVPTVAVVHGHCFAGNAALAGTADLVVATADAHLGMAGPAMIEGAGLGSHDPDEIGPVDVHRGTGGVDVVVDDERAAVGVTRRYLGLVSGSRTPPAEVEAADQSALRDHVPEERRRIHDMRALLAVLCDRGTVLELGRDHAPGMLTALGRLDGRPVALLANDPAVRGGAVDAAGSDKAARFLRWCQHAGLPLVVVCDTPGFMVGPDVEQEGTVRAAGRLFTAASRLTVPVVAVVVRRAYGLGAMAMVGGHLRAPVLTIAWPTAELGPMGLEGAVRLGFRRELEAIEDPDERAERQAQLVALARANADALNVASFGEIDDVVDPAETRARIARVLRVTDGA